jgi:hypothetical protein
MLVNVHTVNARGGGGVNAAMKKRAEKKRKERQKISALFFVTLKRT